MVSSTSTKGRNTTSKETANNKSSSSERRPPNSACRSHQLMCEPTNQEVSGESGYRTCGFWTISLLRLPRLPGVDLALSPFQLPRSQFHIIGTTWGKIFYRCDASYFLCCSRLEAATPGHRAQRKNGRLPIKQSCSLTLMSSNRE